MGQCASAQAASSPATVKLVMPDGSLREFSWSVRPAYILGKDEQMFFVCDSDTLEINRAVAAVPADRELRIGQIYFALPRTMLDRPLKAEEMAALAIRASTSLARSGSKKGRKGTVTPLVFEMEEEEAEGSKEVVKKKVEKRKGSGKGCKFAPELSAIAE